MNRQKGIIALGYMILLGGIVGFVLGGSAAYKFQGMRLDAAKAEFSVFKTKVDAEGRIAQQRVTAQIAVDKANKEKIDAQNSKALTDMRSTVKRLRNARAPSGLVPATAACPSRPDSACFNRPLLERAVRELDQGVQVLVDAGSAAVVDLNSAKQWALTLKVSPSLSVVK